MAGGWLSRGALGLSGILGKQYNKFDAKDTIGALIGQGFTGAAQKGLTRYAGMGRAAQRSIAGGTLGGMYGAFSDDTSVLGGAMMGAGIGAGSAGVGYGIRAGRRYGRMYGAGYGGQVSAGVRAMGRASGRFIRNTITKPYTSIQGLHV